MSRIAPDIIKIDGSLIKNIDKDTNAKKIVKTIVTFAHELNISVVAEFIHSKEVFEVCKALQVDEFQGYYFSEPKPNLA
jgi:EAL domain-containing protein (putative c-di-GMP-specific phosphodiesterase class I)